MRYRRLAAKLGLVSGLSLLLFGVQKFHSPRRYTISVDRTEFSAHQEKFRKLGFEIAGVDIKAHKVFLMTEAKSTPMLSSFDLTLLNAAPVYDGAPDAKYKTPDQVATILNQFAAMYPDLAQISSIGKSLEGRDILVIKITAHVNQAAKKPSVLYNGMHHAREVMSSEVPLDIANTLLSGYGKDPRITHWLDSDIVYIIPMLNPDGNNRVWTSDNMWRKNARGDYGVDINRNYPYGWNSCNGASDNQGAQDYRGPSPGSEPETRALMAFVSATHPTFSISFHSYSELVIYPYGCGNHTETSAVVEPIGKKMAELIPSDDDAGSHYTAGTAPDLLYNADGVDIDWLYHEAHVIPYVIEVNSHSQGFQPDYNQWRDVTVAKLRPAWELLLDRLDGASIAGQVGNMKVPGAIQVLVESTDASQPFSQSYPLSSDGRFRMIVNPGEYRVSMQAGGQTMSSRIVRVADTAVDLGTVN